MTKHADAADRRRLSLAWVHHEWTQPHPAILVHDIEWMARNGWIDVRTVGAGRNRHRQIRLHVDEPARPADLERRQLTLFEDPKEILALIEAGEWSSSDVGVGAASVDGYRRKLREGQDNGTCKSIAKNGMRNPVVLKPRAESEYRWGPQVVQMGNGHHRTACAADLGHAYIPVVWGRNTHDGMPGKGDW